MSRYISIAIVFVVAGCTDHSPSPEARSAPASRRNANVGPQARRRMVVTFTPTALAKLREAHSANKPYLRVGVVSGGAMGFRYDMKFDDRLDADKDYISESGGIVVVVDKKCSLYLEGTTIDWQMTRDGRQGFKFDNPNAVQ